VSPPKEIPVTFRCDESFRDGFYATAAELDMSRSEFIRAAITLFQELAHADKDKLRGNVEFFRKIFVILEKV
jgi:hypothetical protein